MKNIRVLLTIEHQLQAQLLKHSLASCPDLDLIGEATDVIDCLAVIAAEQPHLWIHSWDEGPELSAVLSHVYSYHPTILIIRICPDECAGYAEMRIGSLTNLLKLATRTHQWLEAVGSD